MSGFAVGRPALATYVPDAVLRRLASSSERSAGPHAESYPAALLLVDITGFTTLTTALVQRGAAGTEHLSRTLNGYLDRIIDIAHAHGGDVLKILGDALLISWPAVRDDLAEATRRAAACGLEIASTLTDVEVEGGIRLSLKVGVCAGDMIAAHVGGLEDRWLFLVAGDGPTQLSSLEPHMQTGGLVLSPQAWTLIETGSVGRPIDRGHVRVLLLQEKVQPRAFAPAVLAPSQEHLLRAYIPGVALARLDAGQAEWLGEFRPTTVLFASVRRAIATPSLTDELHDLAHTLQQVVARFQGWSKEITIDDKGTTFVAAFGVPPYTHEDDPVRAVGAALAIQTELRQRGLSAGVGIATGPAFCGPVGSAVRRDFAIIGQHVNLAARLAQVSPEDAVLCDNATQEAAQTRFTFERLPAYAVKGISPVAVYRSRGGPGTRAPTLVDRRAELEGIASRVKDLRAGSGGLLILEGEPGIGKSRVLDECVARAFAAGVRCLAGAAAAIESATPYYAWRPVLQGAIGIASATPLAARRDLVLGRMRDVGSERLAPLLDPILSIDLPDNELTAQMTGEARADNTRELLVRLLAREATADPLMIVLEDVHWLDSASWAITIRARREIPKLLLVLTTRPVGETSSDPIAAARAEGTTLRLGALTRDDALTLASHRMGAAHLAEPVAAFVHERAEGNPLFVEQLTYAMRDGGYIVIEDGTARVASDAADLRTAIVPGTVQRVITSRIDQLPPAEALTLKVASVIGREFTLPILREIHPLRTDEATLLAQLETLTRMDLVRVDASGSEPLYRFTHAITQEVAYALMLSGQSQQLHRSVAERYERAYAGDLSRHHAFLAHHWRKAGVSDRAIEHLERAGAQALRGFANDEAVGFLDLAITEVGAAGLTIDASRRGRWELQLGEAYANLSKYPEGGEHLASGLRLMRRPAPRRGRQEVFWLLRELLEQVLRRIGLWRTVARSTDPERTAAVLRAYWALAEVSYYSGQTVLPLWCTIRMLNAAEGAENPAEMARAFGSTGALFGLIPLPRVAEWYLARASSILGGVGDLATHEIVEIMVGFYYVGVGKWELARERIARADAIARRLGDWRRLADALSNLIEMDCLQGNFGSGASVAEEMYSSATERGDRRWQAEALAAKAYCFTHLGRAGEALRCLTEMKALADAGAATPDQKLKLFGALALTHLSRGENQQALVAGEEAARLTEGQRPAYVGAFWGYAGPAEVRLALWEAGPAGPEGRAGVDRALRPLRTYASVFPVGRPRAFNLLGRGNWLMGQRTKAFESWQHGLAAAQALEMPYEQGLAHYEIGRHLDQLDPARASHLAEARAIFDRLGASEALGRTDVAAAAAT